MTNDRPHILTEQEVDGPPDLVIEILSSSTGYYDLTKKRRVYEESGVKEYRIVDPGERTVDVLVNAGGGFQTTARVVEDGRVASRLLDGLEIEVEPLFKG